MLGECFAKSQFKTLPMRAVCQREADWVLNGFATHIEGMLARPDMLSAVPYEEEQNPRQIKQ